MLGILYYKPDNEIIIYFEQYDYTIKGIELFYWMIYIMQNNFYIYHVLENNNVIWYDFAIMGE